VALVALEHVFFLFIQMFLWTTLYGLRVFGMTEEVAKNSAKLAMNQGLYNGFLAVGLVWALATNRTETLIFFLICVTLAGVFGGLTVNGKIFFIQALPALLALVFYFFCGMGQN